MSEDPDALDWDRLSRYVVAGRVRLGHRGRGTFAPEVGISTRILSDIEKARRSNYDPATLAQLEQALGWRTGSVDQVLHGGTPTEAEQRPPEQPAGDRAVVLQIVAIMDTEFGAEAKLAMIKDVIARDFVADHDLERHRSRAA